MDAGPGMTKVAGGTSGLSLLLDATMATRRLGSDVPIEEGFGIEFEVFLARRPIRLASSSSITVCGRSSRMVERTRSALALLICAVPII